MGHFETVGDRKRAKRMKRLRLAMGYTSQTEFAEWLGIGRNRWNNIENGYPVSRQLSELLQEKIVGLSGDWISKGDPSSLSVVLAGKLDELPGQVAEMERNLAEATEIVRKIMSDDPPDVLDDQPTIAKRRTKRGAPSPALSRTK